MTTVNQPLILAVDDEASNLQLLRQILQDHYRLRFAKDGPRALELAREERPNLILLDVMMPAMPMRRSGNASASFAASAVLTSVRRWS